MIFNVSLFDNKYDTNPKAAEISWEKLKELFQSPPPVRKDKNGVAMSPVRYESGTTRGNENVQEISILGLDIDEGATVEEMKARWQSRGIAFILATTHGHTPEHHKFRLFIPLATPIPSAPVNYKDRPYVRLDNAASATSEDLWLWAQFQEPCIDNLPDPARLFFLPSISSKKAEYICHVEEGEFLDWRTLDYSAIPIPEHITYVAPDFDDEAGDYGELEQGIRQKLTWCCRRVASADEGKGNETLRDMSMLIGGYLWRNLLSEEEAMNELEAATSGWNKRRNIISTIQRGFNMGRKRPLNDNPAKAKRKVENVFQNAEQVNADLERGDLPVFKMNDAGFIELFCSLGHCRNFAYAYDIDKWLAWNGQRWDVSHGTALLDNAMVATAAHFEELAIDQLDEKQLPKVLHFFNKYGNSTSFDSARKKAQNDMRFRRHSDDFNRNAWLLNCKSGTIDLKTGELLPFQREHYITVQIPTNYEPGAACPNWEQFISKFCCEKEGRFLDTDLYHYVISWLYYCLTGDVSAKVFTVWQGTSNSGKSTLTRVFRLILGPELSKEATKGAFAAKEQDNLGHQSFLANLRGSRFVTQAEFGDRKIDTGLVKAVSGGDPISAAKKFQEEKEEIATYKLNFFTNETPRFNINDDATLNRLRIIPCYYKPTQAELLDSTLEARLAAELPAILASIVNDGRKYYEAKRLAECDAMIVESDKVKATQDHFKEWLLDIYKVPTDEELAIETAHIQNDSYARNTKYPFKIPRTEISGAYTAYCTEQGYKSIGRERRNETLKKFGVEERKIAGYWYYAPLRKKTEEEILQDELKQDQNGERK